MSAEEPGLLGNLPKSRPGTRSAKRGSTKAEPGARRGASGVSEANAPDAPRPAGTPPQGDPVGDALKGAAKVAGAGLRVADGVTRGVLRRLPRP